MKFYGDYQVYSESGVDLTLLRDNLRKSPAERLAQNDRTNFAFLRLFGPTKLEPRSSAMAAPLDAELILRSLVESQVQFVLIGGLAMRAHGSAHVTQDADFCYQRTAKNIAALASALAPLQPTLRGAPAGLPFHFDAPTIQAGLNFTLDTLAGPVDFLGELRDIGFFDAVNQLAEDKTIQDWTIRVLSIDGLILAKKNTGRIKDQNHILELQELKKLLQEPRE
jgi:hypothetical protein